MVLDELARALVAVMGEDAVESVVAMARAYHDYAAGHLNDMHLVFCRPPSRHWPHDHGPPAGPVRLAFADAVARTGGRATADAVWSLVHGCTSLHFSGMAVEPFDVGDAVRRLLRAGD